MKKSNKKKNTKIFTKYRIFVCVYIVLLAALNVLARSSKFCDYYTDNIFGKLSGLYTRFTGLFPFSVGEILIPIAAIMLIVAMILGIVLLFVKNNKAKKKFINNSISYIRFVEVLVLTVCLVMTLNCSIPYNCSKLVVNDKEGVSYDKVHLRKVRNYIVKQCEYLSTQMERDENGDVVYDGDVNEEVKNSLQSISKKYTRLKGYYPDAKGMFGSYFMYQSKMSGVYFPFTMEANYNSYINDTTKPFTIAHELVHLKGYMYENEANFFAFLACITSSEELIRYSGYLNVLGYIDNDYFEAAGKEEYSEQVQVSDTVWNDYQTYTDSVYEMLNSKQDTAIISTQVMSEISDDFSNAYLTYYNTYASYNEVTKFLLQYYDGILYVNK